MCDNPPTNYPILWEASHKLPHYVRASHKLPHFLGPAGVPLVVV